MNRAVTATLVVLALAGCRSEKASPLPEVRVHATVGDTASSVLVQAARDRGLAAVRLVALNMAMDGAGRDEIETQIAQEFGTVAGLDALLDDVLARTGA